jgi:hypothetical protein
MSASSASFQAWFVQQAQANSSIANLLAKDSTGMPIVVPYHATDVDENLGFPHITIARYGSAVSDGPFDDSPLHAQRNDGLKVGICVWSQKSIDECVTIYDFVDQMLRGPVANVSSPYFSTYGLWRTDYRDDLFDDDLKCYHLHSEYTMWVRYTSLPGS